MANGIDWFRWHHGSVTDPKFQLVAKKAGVRLGDVLVVWAFILEKASADEDRGFIGEIDFETLDYLIGGEEGDAVKILDAITGRGLIDGSRVSNWEKRQPKRERNDDSSERVAKHRANKNHVTPCNANVTPSNATVTQETPREEKSREELTTTVLRTDADASRPQTDEEIIFGYGVPMLTSAGSSEKHARSFLGSLRKAHGDSAVVAKLRDCFRAKPLQPIEWLAAALPPAGRGGGGKQSAVEARNARVVADWVPPEMRGEA